MKLEDLKKLCDEARPWVWGHPIGQRWLEPVDNISEADARHDIAARVMLPKLIAVAEAAKRNAEAWERNRSKVPEELQWSLIDPAHRYPAALGLVEALAALEAE